MPEVKETVQGLILADSFDHQFLPITLERPRALIPILGVPMIDYTIEFLLSSGIEEIFVLCCAHAEKIQKHIEKSSWMHSSKHSVQPIIASTCTSSGDALREVCSSGLIKNTFVVLSADVITNMNIKVPIQQHLERVKKNKASIMTMIFKKSDLNHRLRISRDRTILGIVENTNELKWYDNSQTSKYFELESRILNEIDAITLRHDLIDCRIDICSPEVLLLFNDNFDWQDVRQDFVREVLSSEVMGYKLFTHILSSNYAGRAADHQTYHTVCNDIINRWVFPFAPEVPFNGGEGYRYFRKHVYLHEYVKLAMTCKIDQDALIGRGTIVDSDTFISRSSIGKNCKIGKNVRIISSHVWDSVEIGDGVEIYNSIICEGVKIYANSIISENSILSKRVEVGPNALIPRQTRLTRLRFIGDSYEKEKKNSKETEEEEESDTEEWEPNELNGKISDKKLEFIGSKGMAYQWLTFEKSVVVDDSDSSDESQEELAGDDDTAGEKKLFAEIKEIIHGEEHRTKTNQLSSETLNGLNVEIRSRLFANNAHLDIDFLSVGKAMIRAVLELINTETDQTSIKSIKMLLEKWCPLLTIFIHSEQSEQSDQIELIHFLESEASSDQRISKAFQFLLHGLYDKDVIGETAILEWKNDDADPTLIKQCEQFLTWLEEAEEEDDDEDDE